MWKKLKTASFRGSARKAITGRKRRVNLFDQQADQSECSMVDDVENVALHVSGDGAPFVRSEREDMQSTIFYDDFSGSPSQILQRQI